MSEEYRKVEDFINELSSLENKGNISNINEWVSSCDVSEALSKAVEVGDSHRGENGKTLLETLLSFGFKLDQPNQFGETPLFHSVTSENLYSLKTLIAAGANVNQSCTIHFDRENYVLPVTKEIKIRTIIQSPISAAVPQGLLFIEPLVEAGANVNSFSDHIDHTQIDPQAARMYVLSQATAHPEVCRYLIHKGADPNLQNSTGFRPIHEAAGEGHLDLVKLLVKNGADIHARVQKWTARDFARKRGHIAVADYLKSIGVKRTLI